MCLYSSGVFAGLLSVVLYVDSSGSNSVEDKKDYISM